ncbi:DegV family protein [Marasmitruncus massiliensis]|uniref:DegV family protein n=1 Tax=Marasmitruncus massiliensis TaxID=1944642 RepID=UPI000C7C3E43|nr:DegV family protein [Marasmitruncus massiliensis]MBE6906221.1 DegV family protein [Oscillospiraceae bacterium]
MEYKLVVDSCCELIPELRSLNPESAPLSMLLDGVNYIDDELLNINHFISAMRSSKNTPKSACPSPEVFAEKFCKGMNVFAVTISSKLSGSYNSALVGAKMVMEGGPERRIHVFDSLSASAGEIAVSLKIKECVDLKMDFDSIVKTVTEFIDGMKTFFILDTLETLIKAGRVSRIAGYAASVMSLRPIMCADNGMIRLYEKARGSVRAFTRLVDLIGESCTNFADRTLVITHCNNERQAHFIKAEAQRRFHFKDIKVTSTGGLSTMYANEGGVIIAF